MAIFTGSPYSGSSGGKAAEPPRKESGGGPPAVPPPPPPSLEISVRTLASDLERMGRGAEETAAAAPLPRILDGGEPARADRSKYFVWAAVVIVGVIVFFFLGYFFLPLVFKEAAEEKAPPPAGPAPSAEEPAAAPPPTFLGHRSFLRSPADETLKFKFESPMTPAYYSIYLSNLNGVLAGAGKDTGLAEIVLERPDGEPAAWTQFLGLLDMDAPDMDFWLNRFERDFTMLARRESGAWRLAYVLKLKPGQSPLLLQTNLSRMETGANYKKFFLNSPGDAQGGFRDAQISGQPVRIQNFSQAGSALVYGFTDDYLIISTSEAGFREAMLRL